MSNFRPSKEQQLAIDAIGKNYLISAGAGSGKTAVLTQRIFKIVKENQRIDNFLVLTFTNLAAGEMKERLRNLLLEDPSTKRFAVEVDNTHIETFDSFYLFLARKYFYILGIDRDISVIPDPIIEIKQRQLLDEIFTRYIVNEDKTMIELIKATSLKTNDAIKAFILNILKSANSQIDKSLYYSHLKNDFCSKEYLISFVNKCHQMVINCIDYLISKVKEACLEDLDDEAAILEFLSELKSFKDIDSLSKYAAENKFPSKRKSQYQDPTARDALANFYKDYIEFIKNVSSKDIENMILDNQRFVPLVLDIALEVDQQIDEFKKKYNAYTFPDISRMTLKLFEDPEIVKEVSHQFDYIMVDEYQDTNDIQEKVLNILGRNNLYMVGDIKQSIYRFRNADCKIFDAKYNNYKNSVGGEEIDLNTSFRSRVEIVDFINKVFSKIMIKSINPIDYSNGHKFMFGQTKYGNYDKSFDVEEWHYQYEKYADCPKQEAKVVADDIISKINNGFMVFDLKKGVNRPCQFSDFAIIIDRETNFDDFRKEFSSRGVPLKSCGKEKLLTSDITVAIKNLVKLLLYALNSDYGEEYKHSYISFARSFFVEMSDQDIYLAFKDKDAKKVLLTPLAQKIELIKEKLRFASLYDILKTLYQEFEIYDHICKITNYYANAHKAEILLDYAKQMDKLALSLQDFVDYFDNLSNFDLDIDYRDNDNQENSVTLINIHQSKGLEYNIVYYPLLNKMFSRNSLQGELFVSKEYGLIFPGHSLLKQFHVEYEKEQEIAEKIRLLYVALTRAKQKIILLIGEKHLLRSKLKMPFDYMKLSEIYAIAGISGNRILLVNRNDDKTREDPVLKKQVNQNISIKAIELKSISIPYIALKKEKASKEVSAVDEDLLIFGTQVHAILEGLDFSNRENNKYNNPSFRKIVDNVLSSPLLKGVTNEMVKAEFAFFDQENNVNGVIDCLVEKDNEILIIDYKLKNIADEEYEKQLRTYYKYISSISDKPIKMYLLAALTGEIKEVKYE